MSSENYEGSFLARLELVDGTQLGFFKIVEAGENRRLESHDYLCANSVLKKSLHVHFQPNSEGAYILSCRPAPLEHKEVGQVSYDSFSDQEYPREVLSAGGSVQGYTIWEEDVAQPELLAAPKSVYYDEKDVSPLANLKAGTVYLAVNEDGWVHRTRNGGLAYLATIVMEGNSVFSIGHEGPQHVYLKSWRSKKNMQTYKLEKFQAKVFLPDIWFAWMTDCDGDDALLKLTILERYEADGSVLG